MPNDDTPTHEVSTGGCLCGHIRFEATGEPYDPHVCACPHCSRLSGGPLMAWVGFRRTAFSWKELGSRGGRPPGFDAEDYRARYAVECGINPGGGPVEFGWFRG
ncbi:hypothetical protein OOK13_04865 [Streptomyces sp. NBC_00378]|uniref:GFA family protein n=1 Tax=unclassified Streptomyces TaxID=2593676 RepID=UPI002259E918|nr:MULTISPECIES: hypothetical protein [unclassified Streptomyces]MCX5107858.1 hypothetical protein [Streptomyces sp. NBC_00378]